jgi:hypothetical protein
MLPSLPLTEALIPSGGRGRGRPPARGRTSKRRRGEPAMEDENENGEKDEMVEDGPPPAGQAINDIKVLYTKYYEDYYEDDGDRTFS